MEASTSPQSCFLLSGGRDREGDPPAEPGSALLGRTLSLANCLAEAGGAPSPPSLPTSDPRTDPPCLPTIARGPGVQCLFSLEPTGYWRSRGLGFHGFLPSPSLPGYPFSALRATSTSSLLSSPATGPLTSPAHVSLPSQHPPRGSQEWARGWALLGSS